MNQYNLNPEFFFNYSYEGRNYIDYKTLLVSQTHFLTAYNEVRKTLSSADDFEILVGTFQTGSFEIPYYLEFISETKNIIEPLFTKDNIEYFFKSLTALVAIINIHKALKGEKPKKETPKENNTTDVHTENGKIINVENLYLNIYKGNNTVTNNISKSFEVLRNDQNVEGIKISGKDSNSLIELSKQDINELAKSNPYLDGELKETFTYGATVYIKKPNFYPDSKKPWQWEFIYNGRPIKAVITDKIFEEAINKGKKFGQGSKLLVDLKKISKWDVKLNTFLEKGFEVTKVINYNLSADIQKSIFD